MKISIILAHPNPGSFNHAIAAEAVQAVQASGHQAFFHDLCREKFQADMPGDELTGQAELPADVQRHCREISDADGIVIVHPNWWSMMPAILKGWLDRVLRTGVAYRFEVNEKGEPAPVGLLKAQSAVIFNTANTPAEVDIAHYGFDPLEFIWKQSVFPFCGVKKIQHRVFSSVIASTLPQRQAWLAEVRAAVNSHYPRL